MMDSSNENASCSECGHVSHYDDYVSGDRICTMCGLIDKSAVMFHSEFQVSETQTAMYTENEALRKEVTFLIKKFRMKVEISSMIAIVSEWLCFSASAFSIRFMTCANYLKLKSDDGSLYLTNDLISKWARKMSISFADLQSFLKSNCNRLYNNTQCGPPVLHLSTSSDPRCRHYPPTRAALTTIDTDTDTGTGTSTGRTETETSDSIEEWIRNLQQTTRDILQNHYPMNDRKCTTEISRECRRIVQTKKDVIFHNLEYVSAAIIRRYIYNRMDNEDVHEFDQNISKVLDRGKVSKIERTLYNSSDRFR